MNRSTGTALLHTLVETGDHRICYAEGRSDRLVVSLAGVGTLPASVPPFEFIGTAWDDGENHVLLASERRRTWLNDTAFADMLVAQIAHHVERLGIREVVCLGNSMGGFMALALPRLTRVDCVIAFSPQYSAAPCEVPEEQRWLRWRSGITHFRVPTVRPLDPTARDHFIFHGDAMKERIHWQRFPKDARLHHFILRKRGHNIVQDMKDRDILRDVVRLAISRKPRKLRLLLEQHFDVARREALAPAEAHLPLHA